METRWATAEMAGQFRHVTITDGGSDPLRAVERAIARLKAGGPVHTEIILNVIPPDRLPGMVAGFEAAAQGMAGSKSALKALAIQMTPPAVRTLLTEETAMPGARREPIFVQDKFRGRLHVDKSRPLARYKLSAGIYYKGEGMVVETRPMDEIMSVQPNEEGVLRWTFRPHVDTDRRDAAQIVTPLGSVVICREQPMGTDNDWTANDPPSPHASGGGARLGVVFY